MGFNVFVYCFGRLVTMLEWREREHEKCDSLEIDNDITLNVL
jgi:hypothetical protein